MKIALLVLFGGPFEKYKWFYNFLKEENKDIDFYFIDPNLEYINYDLKGGRDHTMIMNTIECLELINNKNLKYDYYVRTICSTLFDLNILKKFLENKEREKTIMGSFVGNFPTLQIISGTNLIMTQDLIDFVILNSNKLKIYINNYFNESTRYLEYSDNFLKLLNNHIINLDILTEDVFFSILFLNFTQIKYYYNIPRLDFIKDNEILYHKAQENIDDLFCYRFKTKDRNIDFLKMHLLYKNNFDLKESFPDYKKYYELPNYYDKFKRVIFL